MLFVILWVTFVYFPIAHMVWFWGGPSFASDPTGLIFGFGAIDFAGGTVVHINAGIAGLVGALMIGKRVGYKKDLMAPHSMTLTMVGASLLWVGWFGFNAGSNLEANAYAALAMINTFVATAAAAVAWIVLESLLRGKASMLGAVSGAVAGLVAVTPAAGFAGPMGAIVLGIVATVVCYFFVSVVKNKFEYDDSLDVFGIHCIGGIIGALGTGILVNPALGGAGIVNYLDPNLPAIYDGTATQVWRQLKGVLVTLLWSGIGSAILYKIVDADRRSACERRKPSAKASTSPRTAKPPTTPRSHWAAAHAAAPEIVADSSVRAASPQDSLPSVRRTRPRQGGFFLSLRHALSKAHG